MIGVEPEIVQCTEPNSIGILVLCEGFAVPSHGPGVLGHSPRCAAIALVIKRSVVGPARLLRRRMKSDIAYVDSRSQRHAKGLNRPIEVLIVEGILVVPYSLAWVGHLVGHKPNPIVCRIRLVLVDLGRCPSHDRRLHAHSVSNRRKGERARAAANSKLMVGDIIIHVTLPGMRLTPGVFAWRDVLCFGEVRGSGILCWIQIAHCHCHPMRGTCVSVAAVVVCT